MNFPIRGRGGGARLNSAKRVVWNFPKIHPIWYSHPSLWSDIKSFGCTISKRKKWLLDKAMINISFFTWLKNLIFHLMICAKPIIMDLLIADFLFLPCYICCMTGIAKSVKPVIDHFNKFNSIQSAHCLATRAGRPCLASDRGRSWIIVWMQNKTLTSKQLYSRFVSGIRNNQRNSYEIKFLGKNPCFGLLLGLWDQNGLS